MNYERFNSSYSLLFLVIGVVVLPFFLDYLHNKPIVLNGSTWESLAIASALVLLVFWDRQTTYLGIQDNRSLINSGYRSFRKDIFDIRDIKYIYRLPNFFLSWYGSRMVFYINGEDGKLRQTSLREVAYSASTLERFLRRVKEIKSTIELDPEYEKILRGELLFNDPSENTVSIIEKKLKEKGEKL